MRKARPAQGQSPIGNRVSLRQATVTFVNFVSLRMGRLSVLVVAAACSVLNAEAQSLYCKDRIPLGGVCQTNLRVGAGNDPQRM
jgi:hypothetical protein